MPHDFAPLTPGSSATPEMAPEVRLVYADFTAVISVARALFGGSIGGKLLLHGPLDRAGASVAVAANIAGAATLGIDPSAERLKYGIRNSICDFMVSSLDEALRILKNEVRKKQPVSVCLHSEIEPALAEIVERGVQPDMLAALSATDAAQPLIDRGCVALPDTSLRVDGTVEVAWTADNAPALWLPRADAAAAEALASLEDERHRWLRLAPRYLRKELAARRYLRMTPEESDRFAALLDQKMADGNIGAKIKFNRIS